MNGIEERRENKRRLLMSVTVSILLYGAESWSMRIEIEVPRKRMAAYSSGSMKIASWYYTVSQLAVLVVTKVISIDLLTIDQRKHIQGRVPLT